MSILLAVILSVSASPSSTDDSTSTGVQAPASAPTARSGRELADAAHAALRKYAKATDQDADAAARDLLTIYRELQQDTRLALSQRESLRVTVRGRLDQLATQISKRIAATKASAKSPKVASNVKSVAPVATDKPMAQMGVPAGAGMGAGGAGGQNANNDAGQTLVDLIQNTIMPKSWDINGGNGSIYYWQQQHAIVVRATGEVQGDVSDTLEQLNRATH